MKRERMNCVDEIKRELKCMNEIKRNWGHSPKIEMMQIKWDRSKQNILQIQWDGGSTCQMSKKQHIVSNSSSEAKYRAMSNAVL